MNITIKLLLHFVLIFILNILIIYLILLGLNSLSFILMSGILENQIVEHIVTSGIIGLTCFITIGLLNFLKKKTNNNVVNDKTKNYDLLKKFNIGLSIIAILLIWTF